MKTVSLKEMNKVGEVNEKIMERLCILKGIKLIRNYSDSYLSYWRYPVSKFDEIFEEAKIIQKDDYILTKLW